jgi:hypothetical protein
VWSFHPFATLSKQPNKGKTKMQKKKTTKVKARDLKPAKDAKGGRGHGGGYPNRRLQ